MWASYNGHLPVVRELVDVDKVDVFQKKQVSMQCTWYPVPYAPIVLVTLVVSRQGSDSHVVRVLPWTIIGFVWKSQRYSMEVVISTNVPSR